MAAIVMLQFNVVLEVLGSSVEEKIKNKRAGKEETKLSLFTEDTIKSQNNLRINYLN